MTDTILPDPEVGGRRPPTPARTDGAGLRPAGPARRPPVRGRGTTPPWATTLLVVLTVVSMVTSMVAVWARSTLFDTDRFMAVVEPVVTDPDVAGALSEVVADQVLAALDLDARVTASLEQLDTYLADTLVEAIDPDPAALDRLSRLQRPTLAALAPGIAAAVETRVVGSVDTFIGSPEFAARFPALVQELHRGGVALLRGEMADLPNVYLEDDAVRLDLIPLIVEALDRVAAELRPFLPDVRIPDRLETRAADLPDRLAEALDTRLVPDFGQLTIMSRAELTGLQRTISAIDRLVVLIVVLTVVLAGVTLATSDRRRRTLVHLGIGLAVGIAITAVAVGRLETMVLAGITHPGGNHVANALLGELEGSLRSVAFLVAAAALAAAIAAHLAGRPAWRASVTVQGGGTAAVEEPADRRPPTPDPDQSDGRTEP
jgi:hypothetical protein